MGVYLQQMRNPFLKIRIADERTVIGRGTTSKLETFKYLSRSHASIYKKNNGELYVEDRGSYNGTYVNNKRLGKFLYPLKLGDTLGFGVPHSFKSEGLFCVLLKDIAITLKDMRLLENASSKEIVFNNERKTVFDWVKNNFSGLASEYDTNGEKARSREMESLTEITSPSKITSQARNSNDDIVNKPTTSYETGLTESETDFDFVNNYSHDTVRFPVESAIGTISSEFNTSEEECQSSEGEPPPKVMYSSKYEGENESMTWYKMIQTEKETNFDFLKGYFPGIISVRVEIAPYTKSSEFNTSEIEPLSNEGQPQPEMSRSKCSLEKINAKHVSGNEPATSSRIPQTRSENDFHINKEYFPDLSSEFDTSDEEYFPDLSLEFDTSDEDYFPDLSSEFDTSDEKYFPDLSSEFDTSDQEYFPDLSSEFDRSDEEYFPDLSSEFDTSDEEYGSTDEKLLPKQMFPKEGNICMTQAQTYQNSFFYESRMTQFMTAQHVPLSENQNSSNNCDTQALEPVSQTRNYSMSEEIPLDDIRSTESISNPYAPKMRKRTVKRRRESFSNRGLFLVDT